MLTIRKAGDRGRTRIDWLDSWHTFSFGDYRDPAHTHYRALRVINDDRIAPGGGFGRHPHRDMEILTYVLAGGVAHEDSLGHRSSVEPFPQAVGFDRSIIRAGEWQKMSAGTGVVHAEFNASDTDPLHLLQIWIVPDRRGRQPGYEEKTFPPAESLGKWRVVGSNDGRDGSIVIHQDVVLSAATVRPGDRLGYDLPAGRGAWLHVATGGVSDPSRGRSGPTGAVTVNGVPLEAGDAVAIEGEPRIEVVGTAGGEVLLFDLA